MLFHAIIVAILSATVGCGVGGGGLIVVYMTLFLGYTQNVSQATNLVLFIIAAITSAVYQMKNHTLPPLKLILPCTALSIPGAFLGAKLRECSDEGTLRTFFGYILIFAGLYVFAKLVCTKLKKSKQFGIIQKNHVKK